MWYLLLLALMDSKQKSVFWGKSQMGNDTEDTKSVDNMLTTCLLSSWKYFHTLNYFIFLMLPNIEFLFSLKISKSRINGRSRTMKSKFVKIMKKYELLYRRCEDSNIIKTRSFLYRFWKLKHDLFAKNKHTQKTTMTNFEANSIFLEGW